MTRNRIDFVYEDDEDIRPSVTNMLKPMAITRAAVVEEVCFY